MFARIRHLASHTEGHDKGKKSLLGPSSSSGQRLCVLSGNISTLHRTTSWGQAFVLCYLLSSNDVRPGTSKEKCPPLI